MNWVQVHLKPTKNIYINGSLFFIHFRREGKTLKKELKANALWRLVLRSSREYNIATLKLWRFEKYNIVSQDLEFIYDQSSKILKNMTFQTMKIKVLMVSNFEKCSKLLLNFKKLKLLSYEDLKNIIEFSKF